MRIPLDDESFLFLKTNYTILEQHRITDEAIRMHMAIHVFKKYGINLGEEDWTLDMDNHQLEQTSDPS